MRLRLLLLALVSMSGCATSPLPQVDSNMAWIDFATPMPGGKMLMAEGLMASDCETDGSFRFRRAATN